MNENKFVGGKEASEILGVHQRTLYLWDDKGLIETKRTPGNKRLYNVKKFIDDRNNKMSNSTNLDELDMENRINICYVRVSSHNQKDDLERQKEQLLHKYHNYKIIEDIG